MRLKYKINGIRRSYIWKFRICPSYGFVVFYLFTGFLTLHSDLLNKIFLQEEKKVQGYLNPIQMRVIDL